MATNAGISTSFHGRRHAGSNLPLAWAPLTACTGDATLPMKRFMAESSLCVFAQDSSTRLGLIREILNAPRDPSRAWHPSEQKPSQQRRAFSMWVTQGPGPAQRRLKLSPARGRPRAQAIQDSPLGGEFVMYGTFLIEGTTLLILNRPRPSHRLVCLANSSLRTEGSHALVSPY